MTERATPQLRSAFLGVLAGWEKAPARAPREVLGGMIRLIDGVLAAAPASADAVRLEELRADLWDAQMEEDAKSGALERAFGAMSQTAAEEDARGESAPLPR